METEEKMKVFLVDDDEMFITSLKHALVAEGTDVKTFASGEECLNNIQKEEPGIVVLDYYLNNNSPHAMNGVQILNKIKQHKPDTEVIMLSAQDNVGIALDTLKYGAYDYIVKEQSAFVKIKHDIKRICDVKGRKDEFDRKSLRLKRINLYIIIAIIIVFLLSRIL